VTVDQYDKALAAIEKLQKQEAIAKVWEDARKAHPTMFSQWNVTAVIRNDEGKFSFETSPKEVSRVQASA